MIQKGKIKYLTLFEASGKCNYSQEYLSLRARQGKLRSMKIGRNWYTTEDWLIEYLNSNGNNFNADNLKLEFKNITLNETNRLSNFPLEKAGVKNNFLKEKLAQKILIRTTDIVVKTILAPFVFLFVSFTIFFKEIYSFFKKGLDIFFTLCAILFSSFNFFVNVKNKTNSYLNIGLRIGVKHFYLLKNFLKIILSEFIKTKINSHKTKLSIDFKNFVFNFRSYLKEASWLLVPYLLWVTFAALLNFSIFILNK